MLIAIVVIMAFFFFATWNRMVFMIFYFNSDFHINFYLSVKFLFFKLATSAIRKTLAYNNDFAFNKACL